MILISVIIATYNASKVIGKCLEGLSRQKTNEIEIVIVDGGSTDITLDIVRSYGNLVDTVISEKDRGIYDAWNKAVKIATGEYLMFVGADDYLYPDAFKNYLGFMKGLDLSTVDLISAKSELVDGSGTVIKVIGENFDYERNKRFMYLAHGTCLHKKTLFEQYGMFSLDYKIFVLSSGVSTIGSSFMGL